MTEPSPLYNAILDLKSEVGEARADIRNSRHELAAIREDMHAMRERLARLEEGAWKAKGGYAVLSAFFGIAGGYITHLLGGGR